MEIYGPKFIERLRHSGYRSTTHAISEIVDNAVDAEATDIKIVFVEKTGIGSSYSSITDIYFLDDGKGMTEEVLSKCLIFSDGEGRSGKRIGAFGVGLPNSSIFSGKRVDVYSRQSKKHQFNHIYLDVEKLMYSESTKLPAITKVSNNEFEKITDVLGDIVLDDVSTIVHWSKLDKLDAKRASTLIERIEKLLGRIYRYKLDEISLSLISILNGTVEIETPVLKFDPLFISETPYYATEELWSYSEEEDIIDNFGINTELGNHPKQEVRELFNAKYYYREFLKKDKDIKTQLPLFEALDGFFDQEHIFKTADGTKYKWKIRAASAYESVSNPGVRSGGATRLGKLFSNKMEGDRNFPSANIFFVRAGREIDYGSFGLYKVTDPKNRFWTIEIHFDSDLDDLMGLSNSKQSVGFKYVRTDGLSREDGSQEHLYADISTEILKAIKGMKDKLNRYARNFVTLETSYLGGGGPQPEILSPNQILENYMQRHSSKVEWNAEVQELAEKLHQDYFQHLTLQAVKERVEFYKARLTKEVVLYGALSSGKIFETSQFGNVTVVIINTAHKFYENVLSVIKRDNNLRYVTTSFEMLLSYLAYNMNDVKIHSVHNEEIIGRALNKVEQQFSMQVADFIADLDFRIDKVKLTPEANLNDENENDDHDDDAEDDTDV